MCNPAYGLCTIYPQHCDMCMPTRVYIHDLFAQQMRKTERTRNYTYVTDNNNSVCTHACDSTNMFHTSVTGTPQIYATHRPTNTQYTQLYIVGTQTIIVLHNACVCVFVFVCNYIMRACGCSASHTQSYYNALN